MDSSAQDAMASADERYRAMYPELDDSVGHLASRLASSATAATFEEQLAHIREEDPDGDYQGIEAFTPTADFSALETEVFPPLDVEAMELAREAELVLFAVSKDIVRVRNEMQAKHAFSLVSGSTSLNFVTLQSYAVKVRRETADFAADLQDYKKDYILELGHLQEKVSLCKNILAGVVYSVTERLHSLQSEVLHTSSLADKMLEEARRVISIARKEIIDVEQSRFLDDIDTPLNCIKVGWSTVLALQKKVPQSRRAANFMESMKSLNLPICNDAYVFIQSPSRQGHCLNIASYAFAPRELSAILAFICAHPKLNREVEKLVLFDCSITDDDCKNIATAVKHMPLLRTLSLRENNIGDVGVTYIATALWETGKNMQLQALNLEHNNIGIAGAKALAGAMMQCAHLVQLSVGDNPILDAGLFYILQALLNPARKAYKAFQWFSPEDEIDDDNDQAADHFFLPSETIGSQTDGGVSKGDIAADWNLTATAATRKEREEEEASKKAEEAALAKEKEASVVYPLFVRLKKFRVALSCVTTLLSLKNRGLALSSLNISRCGITKLSGPMVAAFIREHRSLGNWVFDHNELGDQFVEDVVGAMAVCPVVSLSMRGCQLTDTGVEKLVEMASKAEHLTGMDLSHNEISNVGAAWLASLSMKFLIDHARIGRRAFGWKPEKHFVEQPPPEIVPPPAGSSMGGGGGGGGRSRTGSIARGMEDTVPFSHMSTADDWEREMRDPHAPDAVAIDDDLISLGGIDDDQVYPIDRHDCMVPDVAEDGHMLEWSILGEFLAKQRDRGKAISLQAYKFLRERLIWERQLRSVRRDGKIDLQAHYYGTEIGRGVDETMIDIL